jgi:hypothetical protein
VGDIEYAVDGAQGRERLPSFLPTLVEPAFGVQTAARVSRAIIGSRDLKLQYACIFVGTPVDFKQNEEDCAAWQFGDRLPPKYKRVFKKRGTRDKE